MNWLQKLMYGRYGPDQLTMALFVVTMVVTLGFSFTPLRLIGMLISYAVIIYIFFRIFSKRHDKRRAENAAFLKIWNKITPWFHSFKRKWSERKQYRYFKCPKCGQQLRAPRGKGKIQVTCQKCRNEFVTKV